MGNNNSSSHNKQQKDNKRYSDSTVGCTTKDKRNSDHRDTRNVTAIQNRKQCRFCRTNVGQRTPNPFIVFYLRLRKKRPNKPVTELARVAGRLWSRMSIEERKKYIDIANAEKKKKKEERTWKKHTRSNKKMDKH